MAMIPAGKRTELVTIQKPAGEGDITFDDAGRATTAAGNWPTHFAPYVQAVTRGGSEWVKSGIVDDTISHVFRLNWSTEAAGITRLMRLVRGDGTTLDIVAAFDPDGRGRDVIIHAKEST